MASCPQQFTRCHVISTRHHDRNDCSVFVVAAVHWYKTSYRQLNVTCGGVVVLGRIRYTYVTGRYCVSVYLFHYLTNLMHEISFTISFISCLYMFRPDVLIIRGSKLRYTASGIITPIGGRLVHGLQRVLHMYRHKIKLIVKQILCIKLVK